MSVEEAKRMKRGAFLPAVLILPVAAMFGFDASKSQPMHFLMVFSVASCLAGAVVSISWYGARRRIAEFSKTRLTVEEAQLVWTSPLGETVLPFADIAKVDVQKVRGDVRSIHIMRRKGGQMILEGYESMDEIAATIAAMINGEVNLSDSWIGF